ncbi:hypothetical protein ACQPW3_25970 [Actinosynnema sp. CA-248983]
MVEHSDAGVGAEGQIEFVDQPCSLLDVRSAAHAGAVSGFVLTLTKGHVAAVHRYYGTLNKHENPPYPPNPAATSATAVSLSEHGITPPALGARDVRRCCPVAAMRVGASRARSAPERGTSGYK